MKTNIHILLHKLTVIGEKYGKKRKVKMCPVTAEKVLRDRNLSFPEGNDITAGFDDRREQNTPLTEFSGVLYLL